MKKEKKYYGILILIAILLCLPLLGNAYIPAHDIDTHLARNYATMEGIKEGQFPPMVCSNFVKGFGYSYNLFYPPLSTYIASILRLIVPNYLQALYLLVLLVMMIAGITMFELVKKITKRCNVALITSVLYMTSLYFLTDIYVRMAIGEIMSFMFFPILFYGLYTIFYEKGEKNYLLSLGAAGILLSHNISSLLAVFVSSLFILAHIDRLSDKVCRKQIWKNLLINALLVLLLTAFFYVPLVQSNHATSYMAMKGMASYKSVSNHAIYPSQLIFGKFQKGFSIPLQYGTDEMLFSLGFPILIPLLFTPFVLSKIRQERKLLYGITLTIGIMTALMATTIFPWDKMPQFILNIQFPWRMLLISNFFLSIIAGINIEKCFVNFKIQTVLLLTLILFIHAGQYILAVVEYDDSYDETFLSSTDDVKSLPGKNKTCSTFEYLPEKAYNKYTVKRNNEVIVLSGNAKITNEKKEKNYMSFEVQENGENSILELPYIYYLGYHITFNEEEISYEESEHGFISIQIPQEQTGEITISYKGTTTSKITFILSILSVFVWIGYAKIENKKQKENVKGDEV